MQKLIESFKLARKGTFIWHAGLFFFYSSQNSGNLKKNYFSYVDMDLPHSISFMNLRHRHQNMKDK